MIKQSLPFLCLLTIGLFSCKKDENKVVNVAQEQTFVPQTEMRNFLIKNMGFLPSKIEETKDEFIVSGDISFPKNDFWERYPKPQGDVAERHFRTQYKVTANFVSVFINSSVPAAWKTAFQSAISEWNGLTNTRISFTEVTSAPANGITVSYENVSDASSNLVIAKAEFPTQSGYAGYRVRVHSGFGGSALNAKTKVNAAVHELMHCIGFMHTDDGANGYGQILTGINSCDTGGDPASVLQPAVGEWIGFSGCDKAAIKKRYPKP